MKLHKKITILGNLKINSKDKLLHMKDSFMTFRDISDNWLINIRGPFRKEALKFLRTKLGKKMIEFELLDDTRGWVNNAQEMILKAAKNEYILIWNEDHFNLAPQTHFSRIATEMSKDKSDYLPISWWHFGKFRNPFNNLKLKTNKFTDFVVLDENMWKTVRGLGHKSYLISLLGLFRKEFLVNMMAKDRLKLPHSYSRPIFTFCAILEKLGFSVNPQTVFQSINRYFGFRLSRYTHEAPFELEKDPSRIDFLPLRLSLPKRELFASVDDDQSVKNYSLVSRGLYKHKTKVRNPGI